MTPAKPLDQQVRVYLRQSSASHRVGRLGLEEDTLSRIERREPPEGTSRALQRTYQRRSYLSPNDVKAILRTNYDN